MSHGKLRTDKNCLNCNHQVLEKYCPNCGQENVEPRQPFYYLFTHFIEDFTHYDGQFWGTIKNLLFSPGKLTRTYLDGKRQAFVPPVKLYIFISFITFFIFAVFPPFKINYDKKSDKEKAEYAKGTEQFTKQASKAIEFQKQNEKDSAMVAKFDYAQKVLDDPKTSEFQKGFENSLDMQNKIADDTTYKGYKTFEEYKKGNKDRTGLFSMLDEAFAKKLFELKEKGVKKGEIFKSLAENAFHNLPKALFIYLPVFALFLWIFHRKKKWWYFDHGIFTLHYFSFLLVSILLFGVLLRLTNILSDYAFFNPIIAIIMIAILIYMAIYFYVAHHRVYKSSRFTSIIVGFIIWTCNFFAFTFLIIALGITSFLMMH